MIFLLISTSGMTIYKLQCKCLHHEHVSFFVEPESCHKASNSGCCGSTCHCSEAKHAHENHSCAACDTHETFFVKLTTEFITEDDTNVICPLQAIILDVLSTDLLFQKELSNEDSFNDIINSPPPRILSGQKIVKLFHQFKFDQVPQLS